MPLTFHKKLLAGHYRALADKPPAGQREGERVSLIGAYCFLGRIDEAEALYAKLDSSAASNEALIVSRFFLGIGFTRLSDYARAQRTFTLNESARQQTALEKFYVLQGRVFYSYYTGRVRAALGYSKNARQLALRSCGLFERFLSTDAYGHCRVVAGEIHHGLRLLEEARELALKLGNRSFANASAISAELYDAEYGLTGAAGLAKLEKRFKELGTEHNYSQADVGLELSRQFTLQGRFREATKALEAVAPSIYANQNRRQEIQLNLRLAELACRRGDSFASRHHLQFLRRLLHNEADSSYELAALGLERKLLLAEPAREEEARALELRWKELARDFGNTRDDNLRVRAGILKAERENQEDRTHFVLQSSRLARKLPEKLRPLLEGSLLCEAANTLGLIPGKPALAILPAGQGSLSQSQQGILWHAQPFSALQSKILRLLSLGDCTKERLVEQAWGYRYDPLRHDPVVYAATSALRKALGSNADWLQATESGYRFAAEIHWQKEEATSSSRAPAAPERAHLSTLNHRQIEILEWLRTERFLSVGQCRDRFAVSEITALRDLSDLRGQSLVLRTGNARATRYSLPQE